MTDDQKNKVDTRLNQVSQLTAEANEHYIAGRFADATPLYHQALALQEEVLGPEHPGLANTLRNVANLYYVQEKYAEAEAAYSRSLSLLRPLHGPQSIELVDSLVWLAQSRFSSQRYDEAKEPYRLAIEILEKYEDAERLGEVVRHLAHLLYFVGEYAESEPYYLRALQLFEESLGPEHLSVAGTAWQLGRLYHLNPELGQKAEGFFKRAAEIYERAHGPDHLDVAESLYRLADHYRSINWQAEAEPLYQRAMTIIDAHPEPMGFETFWMRSGYTEFLRETDREAEAKALEEKWGQWNAFEETLRANVEKREATLGADHPDFATSLYELAGACFFEQKYGEAEEYYQRALEIREKVLGPDHPDIAESLSGVARMYRFRERFEEAGELVARAAAIQERAFGREHPEYAHALEYQALLAEDLGEPDRTEEFYRSALEIYQKALGEESRDFIEGLYHFASFFTRQERFSEAERVLRDLLRLAEKEVDVADLEKADYFELAAHVFENLGNVRESEDLRARAERIFQAREPEIPE